MNASDWPLYSYRATVERIIDGDTISVELSLGCHVYNDRRIRLLGYNAPELFSGDDRVRGAEARDALELIIPIGCRVYIRTHLDRTSFDRLLGTCYVEGSDGDLYKVSEAMIAGGFGAIA